MGHPCAIIKSGWFDTLRMHYFCLADKLMEKECQVIFDSCFKIYLAPLVNVSG